MGKSELDDFNDREVKPSKKMNTSVTWGEEETEGEAVCAVCDSLFTPITDRPPIFCPSCKAALKHSINR